MGKEILRWFYCLPISGILIGIVLATMLWYLLSKKLESTKIIYWIDGMLFLVAMAAIVCFTLGIRNAGNENGVSLIPLSSYYQVLLGGNPEILRSNFMNIVLFYPAGLLAASLLPQKWPGWFRCLLVVLTLTAVSAGIEALQYRHALGQCEIDDIIHNVVGALLGSLTFGCLFGCLKKKNL